jgi:hypothetical protein
MDWMGCTILNFINNEFFISFPDSFFIISFILFCHFFTHNRLNVFFFSFFIFSTSFFNLCVFFLFDIIKFNICQCFLLLSSSQKDLSITYNLVSPILQDISWPPNYSFSKLKIVLPCYWLVLAHNILNRNFSVDCFCFIDQTSFVFTIITKC